MLEKVEERSATNRSQNRYYVEFNIKQQRNFDNCIISNQIVMTPNRVITLSDIRIKDMRKFVYYQVLNKFTQLHPNNIELAYRVKRDGSGSPGKVKRDYISLAGMGNMTIHELIEKEYWQKAKCDIQFKESLNMQIGNPKTNETLYVRFI